MKKDYITTYTRSRLFVSFLDMPRERLLKEARALELAHSAYTKMITGSNIEILDSFVFEVLDECREIMYRALFVRFICSED